MEKDILIMTERDRKRLHVIRKTLERIMTQEKASELLALSTRHIRRLVKVIKEKGDAGIIHKSRGRKALNAFDDAFKSKITKSYKKHYMGFGPTLACEKLEEREQLHINRESLRLLLLDDGLWQRKRKVKKKYKWRARKAYKGELVQMDGSHHNWFEGRGEAAVLMAMIDDATGDIFCKFYTHEGTFPAMDCFREYVRKHGLPLSIYLDRHTTYKSPAKQTIEDELNGIKPMSHFQRALTKLDVKLIYAYSPQAKGRVERLFNTLQDRLIKEMRLANISTIKEANSFLIRYLPKYNKKFRVPSARPENVHRRIYKKSYLENTLAIKIEKSVRNDRTLVHQNQWYQILNITSAKKVVFSLRYDGQISIKYNGKKMNFKAIPQPPKIKKTATTKKSYKGHKPAPDNPFNNFYYFSKRDLIERLKEKRDERIAS